MKRFRNLRRTQLLRVLGVAAAALALCQLAPSVIRQQAFTSASLPRRLASPPRARASAQSRSSGLRAAGRLDDTGVIIANLGSPEEPTAAAVREFLAEFLHDYRVVDENRWLWCPILHGFILPFRPAKVAKLYESVWTPEGSPLMSISKGQRDGLAAELLKRTGQPVKVTMGMSYGAPSIETAVKELEDAGVKRVIVLPMYPQYSSATTGSIWDYFAKALKSTRKVPEVEFVHHYHNDPGYIKALAGRVRDHWEKHGVPDKLLFSFHGIPVRYKNDGDYYNEHCEETAKAVAKELDLPDSKWFMTYQSQFGNEEWLSPKTDKTLEAWGKKGMGKVDVMCPGFAADCLETIEEIGEENREIFQEAGGGEFLYIPALNDGADHISALATIVQSRMASASAFDVPLDAGLEA